MDTNVAFTLVLSIKKEMRVSQAHETLALISHVIIYTRNNLYYLGTDNSPYLNYDFFF